MTGKANHIAIPSGTRRACPPLAIYLLALLTGACFGDVAHDNPFDPISDDFAAAGSVTGVVSDRALVALPGVRLRLSGNASPANWAFETISDAEGRYRFEAVPEGRFRLSAEKEGYMSTADSSALDASAGVIVNVTMNGMPVVTHAVVRTAHINRVWPPPTDFTILEVQAQAGDTDGLPDLADVSVEIPALNFSDTLVFTETPGIYRKDLDEAALGMASLHDLIGSTLTFVARDRLGAAFRTSPFVVTRIVSQTPVVSTPQAGAVLSDPEPLLTWVCQSIPFAFTYRVEIVRVDDVVRNAVLSQGNLLPDSVCDDGQVGAFQVASPLEVGSYFWTISIVDEFGNWSRSREAGFVIN